MPLFQVLTYRSDPLTDFYRAMLCIRGTSHGPVSVRLSVTSRSSIKTAKQTAKGTHKQHHTIAQGL